MGASFLLEKLKNEATTYKIANEVEELKAKYEIEKSNGNGSKYLIYTSTGRLPSFSDNLKGKIPFFLKS